MTKRLIDVAEAIAASVAISRVDQGLPVCVTDEEALHRVATLIVASTTVLVEAVEVRRADLLVGPA